MGHYGPHQLAPGGLPGGRIRGLAASNIVAGERVTKELGLERNNHGKIYFYTRTPDYILYYVRSLRIRIDFSDK